MVHEVRLDEMIGQMEAASHGVDDPFEALMVGVRAAVENFMANPSYLRINLRVGHAWGIKEVAPGISSVFEHAWQRTVDRMVPIFEAGIRRGLFYPDDPSIMARIANAHVQIQMARWLEDGERADLDTTFAAIEEQMRRSFCLRDAANDEGE
jgi:hypothetical protein